ncbi:hypothetical protein SNE40_000703 [Patella caerulea]|uniref:Uncharacterized protein n=1 Tax=Patella caerulea TaxID=87958 RepID=A0AAN8KH28_PATCE
MLGFAIIQTQNELETCRVSQTSLAATEDATTQASISTDQSVVGPPPQSALLGEPVVAQALIEPVQLPEGDILPDPAIVPDVSGEEFDLPSDNQYEEDHQSAPGVSTGTVQNDHVGSLSKVSLPLTVKNIKGHKVNLIKRHFGFGFGFMLDIMISRLERFEEALMNCRISIGESSINQTTIGILDVSHTTSFPTPTLAVVPISTQAPMETTAITVTSTLTPTSTSIPAETTTIN